ncbi:hypothetical protein Tco_1571451 [Tanacetum coccineum]
MGALNSSRHKASISTTLDLGFVPVVDTTPKDSGCLEGTYPSRHWIRTIPLEVSLGSTFIASVFLTRPSAPLIVSIVGVCSALAITGQMADFIALVYKPCQYSASYSVVVVVVGYHLAFSWT